MKRRTFDIITSMIGLALAALLLVAGGLLTWAHNFVHDEVHSQLVAQQIYFPKAGDPSVAAPEFAAMHRYSGQLLSTGQQAEVYADHYIAVHLLKIGGGQTYAQLSGKAIADPTNVDLQNQVSTMFKGETLRGLLLNAYAFDKTATIAEDAALAAWIGASVMLALGGLGMWHAHRVPAQKEFLTGQHERIPENV